MARAGLRACAQGSASRAGDFALKLTPDQKTDAGSDRIGAVQCSAVQAEEGGVSREPELDPKLDPRLPSPGAVEQIIADGLATLRAPAVIAREVTNLIDGGMV